MQRIFGIVFLSLVAFSPSLSAQGALDEVQSRGELRWGGDEEGGAPYIYRTEQGTLTGFEIDLMDELARRLGVKSVFKQSDWKNLLIELNQARSFDIACNGIELTPKRLRTSIATNPYFVYELFLFGRFDETRITNWDGLQQPRPNGSKWKVAVLEGSAAYDVMNSKFSQHVDVRAYGGTSEGFREVELKNVDFTVTDTPAAIAYGSKFRVKQVGRPIAPGYYVMYVRRGDETLKNRVDVLLREITHDGTLQRILAKYGLWSETQASIATLETDLLATMFEPSTGSMSHWCVVFENLPLLLRAAGMTIFLSLVSMPLAIVFGLAIALGRVYGPSWLRWIFVIYVEVIRGTPLLLQLLFIYFGLLPAIVNWLPVSLQDFVRQYSPVLASIAGLALNYAAYEAEIYRAGLLAVPSGQTEAALALGMSRRQAIRFVIVPQAFRMVLPPVTNDFINLFKDTAVCSVITVVDLSKRYNIAVNNSPDAFVELAIVTAALYLAMSYPLALATRRMENQPTRVMH